MDVYSIIINNSPKVKKFKFPLSDEWINTVWYIHKIADYSATRRNTLIHSATWMNIEKIILSERSKSQKVTYCIIPFIQKVQNRQIYKGRKYIRMRGEMASDC